MMKPILLCLIAIVSFSACKKDEDAPARPGKLSVKLNGVVWQGTPYVFRRLDGSVEISLKGGESESADATRLSFWLSNVPVSTNSHSTLFNDSLGGKFSLPYAGLMSLVGGDAICDQWSTILSDSLTNYVAIDSGSNAKEISGTFAVSLARLVRLCPDTWPFPDTMRFSEGRFSISL